MRIEKLFLFAVLLPLMGHAQSWETIETSGQYIWGTGNGTTVAEADRHALADLISKIATHVSSDFQIEEKETTHGTATDRRSYVRNRVQTYSQATLTNAERLILKNEPDARVGRYIKKSEVSRIFESRQRKAVDMVQAALRAEEAGKADDALRNYYWALALVRSLQYPNEAYFCDDSSVDYTYIDCRDWSAINRAKDGTGVLELARGNQSTKYQLKWEYEYVFRGRRKQPRQPVIKVRTWQPEKDPNFGLYGPGDFK